MNITKRKAVHSVLKNHKPFFINIGNYRDISVQNCPLSAYFWPVKFWSRDRAPPNLVCIKHHKHPHCVQISALHVEWFWNYTQFNNFWSQKLPFLLCFFVSQFTITWPRISKIGTQNAFINCYVKCKFRLSRFYCLLVISKSILICQNSGTKPMVLRARAKSQLPITYFKGKHLRREMN